MACSANYNLCIKQGSTFSVVFVLRHLVTTIAAAAITDTMLEVAPLAHEIPSGAVLTFGATSVTTTVEAEIGDRTLEIEPLTIAIPKGATAKGSLVDLSGQQARASIRRNFEDPEPLVDFDCSIDGSEVAIALSSVASAALPANITPGNLRRIGDIQTDDFGKVFNPGANAYFWDLELYNSGSPPIVTRWIDGRVLCSAEATK
jgi:hypothetical protein